MQIPVSIIISRTPFIEKPHVNKHCVTKHLKDKNKIEAVGVFLSYERKRYDAMMLPFKKKLKMRDLKNV